MSNFTLIIEAVTMANASRFINDTYGNLNTTRQNTTTTSKPSLTSKFKPDGIYIIFHEIFLVLAILFYLIIIGTVLLDRSILKNRFNIILLSLALLDLTALGYQFLIEFDVYRDSRYYTPLFFIDLYITTVFYYGSITHSFFIALNRAVAIFVPMKYKKWNTTRNMLIVVAIVWLVSLLYSWPYMGLGITYRMSGNLVTNWWIHNDFMYAELIYSGFTIGASMLLYFVLFAYIRWKKTHMRDSVAADTSGQSNEVLILVQSFYIAFTQALSLTSSYAAFFSKSREFNYYFWYISIFLSYTANPLMYTTIGTKFRNILLRKFRKVAHVFPTNSIQT